MNLLGNDFWNCFRVWCSWFDSGYMFPASLRVDLEENHTFLRAGWTSDRISSRSGRSEDGIFCRILLHFSHSVRMDVSAHFSALDGEEFFVVDGSGWQGRRESDSPGVLPHQFGACLRRCGKTLRR